MQLQVVVMWLKIPLISPTWQSKFIRLVYYTVVFAWCHSASGGHKQLFSLLILRMSFKGSFFFNLGKVLALKIVLERHQTPHKKRSKQTAGPRGCIDPLFSLRAEWSKISIFSRCMQKHSNSKLNESNRTDRRRSKTSKTD